MPSATSARLQLIAAAVLFSTGGAAIKAADFTGWQIAGFRSGVAAIAIALAIPAARRGWTHRTGLVGIGYAACLTLYVLANRLTTAANTIYLQSTAPLYLLVLGPWLLQEPIHRQDIGLLLAVGAGLVLVFSGVERPLATAPDPATGNLLAVTSGFFWALTVCGLRWIGIREGRRGSAAAAVVWGNLVAFLASLPMALPVGRHTAADWAVIGYLGVFQIALAYFFVTNAIQAIPALEASLLLLIEPVLNPIWAWIFQGERPAASALLGGGFILTATALKGWLDSRRTRLVVPPGELAVTPADPGRER